MSLDGNDLIGVDWKSANQLVLHMIRCSALFCLPHCLSESAVRMRNMLCKKATLCAIKSLFKVVIYLANCLPANLYANKMNFKRLKRFQLWQFVNIYQQYESDD